MKKTKGGPGAVPTDVSAALAQAVAVGATTEYREVPLDQIDASGTFQEITPVDDATRAHLKAQLETVRLPIPLVLDENKTILDGHTRYSLFQELVREGHAISAVFCVIVSGLTDVQKSELAAHLNWCRRNMTVEERKIAAMHYIRRHSTHSDERIARVLTVVSRPTVTKYRCRLEEAGEIPVHDRLLGDDGRLYTRPIPKKTSAETPTKKPTPATPSTTCPAIPATPEGRFLAAWWQNSGFRTVTCTDLLTIAVQSGILGSEGGVDDYMDIRRIGHVIKRLSEATDLSHRILTITINKQRAYQIFPSGWTIHGPVTTG